MWSSSWWNQHSSAFSAYPAQQLRNFNCCPATAPLNRKVFSSTGDLRLSLSCRGEQQGIGTSTAWAIQQRKTACRELLHTVLQMWAVKDIYTPCLHCQMCGHPKWHGRISTGRGVSDTERRSQWPRWELIWGSPVSGTASPGSQMLPFSGDRLWDVDPAHRCLRPKTQI